jgi:hypothetical protein
MVYYKLILNNKREKADRIYPIVLRVTFNRNKTPLNKKGCTQLRILEKSPSEKGQGVYKNFTFKALAYSARAFAFYRRIYTSG